MKTKKQNYFYPPTICVHKSTEEYSTGYSKFIRNRFLRIFFTSGTILKIPPSELTLIFNVVFLYKSDLIAKRHAFLCAFRSNTYPTIVCNHC